MKESKFLTKKKFKKKKDYERVKKYLFSLFSRVLCTAVLVLLLLIGFKMDKNFKVNFHDQVYNQTFPFHEFKKIYQKYFGESLSLKAIDTEEQQVFDETLNYKSLNSYQDGVKLEVTSNYMVPSLESGIVVFLGEKEGYGDTVIIQQVNGVDAWYGNIKTNGIQLYDYIEKGKLLGEAQDNKLYLAFQKEGKFQNYQEYLS